MTLKGQGHDANTLRAQYLLKTDGDAIQQQSLIPR